MDEGDASKIILRRAEPSERQAALELALQKLPPEAQREIVAQAAADHPDRPFAGLWTALQDDQLLAATWAQFQAGRAANVWPPQIASGHDTAEAAQIALRLLVACCQELEQASVDFAQALLQIDHGPEFDALLSAGFEHAADLLYLVCVAGSFPAQAPETGLKFETYTPGVHERLAAVVERSYESTRDCPRMNGVRSVEETLAGYKAAAVFAPRLWLLVRHNECDVGCLLLTDHPGSQQMELAYMGVTPEARGNGWGVAIVRHAQWLARSAARARLVLAVDAANEPAIRAYVSAGFVSWDRRSVLLSVFPRDGC
jgi:ribosomal protein S18 acetylase RimI-like enzyme